MLPEELCWEVCQYLIQEDHAYLTLFVLSGIYAKYARIDNLTTWRKVYEFKGDAIYRIFLKNNIIYYLGIFQHIEFMANHVIVTFRNHHDVKIYKNSYVSRCTDCIIAARTLHTEILREINECDMRTSNALL